MDDLLLLKQADSGSFMLSFLVTSLPDKGMVMVMEDKTECYQPVRMLPLREAAVYSSGSSFSTELVRPSDLHEDSEDKDCTLTVVLTLPSPAEAEHLPPPDHCQIYQSGHHQTCLHLQVCLHTEAPEE